MIEYIWLHLYNLFVIPLLHLFLNAGKFFNKKIKLGIQGRKRLFEELILNTSGLDHSKKLIWFHSSSLGEFEQAKPIIEKLKESRKVNILITFFSPSGFENSKKYPYADLVSYIPLDTPANAQRFVQITKPDLAVIMRYDIWPNHMYQLFTKDIPAMLVDATMRDNSARKNFFAKSFHASIYKKMTKILTVSENDANNFKEFGITTFQVEAVGDTRFDRVYQRSLVAKEKNLIRPEILKDKKILVAGSTWFEDEDVMIPAIITALKYHPELLVIIAPHEPTIHHLEKLENDFSGKEKTIRFSYLNNYSNERVVLVDSIGILLTLYCYADITFVGGSFKSNIHNSLEAAVYGIPVMFGPKIQNSQEAHQLADTGGGIIIKNKKEAYRNLKILLTNENLRKEKGIAAGQYVLKNIGATEKILEEVYKYV
jgi:3-deoxy-D-manno-octulosonic-acid transferase